MHQEYYSLPSVLPHQSAGRADPPPHGTRRSRPAAKAAPLIHGKTHPRRKKLLIPGIAGIQPEIWQAELNRIKGKGTGKKKGSGYDIRRN